jgi:hypothetical protein
MRRLSVQVRDLRVGDVLIPTNREVCGYGASRGVRTPPGKTDVDLRPAEPSGTDELPIRRCTFGTYTRVTILRNA